METKELREQLKGTDEKYYEVTVTLQVDDETEEDKTYFFRKPKTPSYDRYLKTVQTSNSKALTAFCLDNIHPDQRETLEADFKEYRPWHCRLARSCWPCLACQRRPQ